MIINSVDWYLRKKNQFLDCFNYLCNFGGFISNFCKKITPLRLIDRLFSWTKIRAPDKLRICVFYAMKTSKNACIIRSECTHYAYILLCKAKKILCVYGHPTHPIFQPPTLTFFISNYSILIFANDPINFYTEFG